MKTEHPHAATLVLAEHATELDALRAENTSLRAELQLAVYPRSHRQSESGLGMSEQRTPRRHTAGPWSITDETDIIGMENDPENGCVGMVDVAYVYLRTVTGRTDANARLIAAAPDLLEALKKAEAALSDIGDAEREPGDDVAWCEARAAQSLPFIRAAIAKAEGGGV